MNDGENRDEQTPNPACRRFDPCRCDAAKGDYNMSGCRCSTEEDGGVSHRGCEIERHDHQGRGFPREARR